MSCKTNLGGPSLFDSPPAFFVNVETLSSYALDQCVDTRNG